MCVVCVLINKGALTPLEAKKALWEQVEFANSPAEEAHMQELYIELEHMESEE